jgi:dimethylamine/trimethylamine dehydrogenase
MRWIPQLPGLGEWGRIVNYRTIQLDKLKNVEIIRGRRLTAQDVAEYGAEIVVVATGSFWATDGLNGASHATIDGADASLPWQATPDQIMGEGKELAGERVVVFDNDGYYMGVSIAEKLALDGKRVTLMTPLGHVASYMHFTLEAPNMHRRLHSLGVEIVPYHLPSRVEQGAVVATHVYDVDGHERTFEAEGVVWVSQRRSNEALYRELKDVVGLERLKQEGVDALYRIGDCEAPRLAADAIFSGHRLAREIDSPDPSIPLPFKRERRLVDAESVARERAETEAAYASASVF